MTVAIVKTAKIEFSAEERRILEKARKLTDELGDALRNACDESGEDSDEILDLYDLADRLDETWSDINATLDLMDYLEDKYND